MNDPPILCVHRIEKKRDFGDPHSLGRFLRHQLEFLATRVPVSAGVEIYLNAGRYGVGESPARYILERIQQFGVVPEQ
jgi:hypothetical protein